MIADNFKHIETWVFDLDNTLYPPSVRLFDQIEVRMTDYVARTLDVSHAHADHLRASYWQEYGTTLAGLMTEHDIDPDPYLHDVHDIDFGPLTPDPKLTAGLQQLEGRRIVYTNGSKPYAHQVLKARGIDHLFDAIYGVEHADYRPKPDRAAFETVFAMDGLAPDRAAMFEDDTRNLAVPYAMGMRTVHVAPDAQPADHIEYHTADLSDFLTLVK
ncbi:pyrimidine 5'-nucleotidase [Parasulfitobacter algicola]|uniref:Pyrimidine 5'-nucleotidase n=1 Tax=Parasulfitobacter algicola TaxID=2614809 RepID=A0ABX2IP73_9RHOB|nr:pyrimidine 5'-nucleotidase [Sulfitobacter algicola]NSX54692.1 pyrimidine 5'-nucleotidase [Sulfitobacter algicola]